MDPEEMQGLGAQAQGAPQGAPPPDPMTQQLQGSSAMFDKMTKGKDILGKARESFDHLMALGDNVTVDDITQMGASLVGAGLAPAAVAGLLAQMPPGGGTALSGWVQQQEQALSQREQALNQAHASMQHHVGVNAMRMLAGHHLGPQPGGAPPSGPLGLMQ